MYKTSHNKKIQRTAKSVTIFAIAKIRATFTFRCFWRYVFNTQLRSNKCLKKNPHYIFYSLSIFFYILALSGCASSPEKTTSYKQNNALVYSEEMSTKTPIHVHLFSTSETDLGRESAKDTANAMVKSAPHLLAVDIVDRLRQLGFTQVTLDESAGKPSDNALNLIGRFTILHPGTQNLRVWIGFGAGKSKVCVDGQLIGSNGETLTDFSQCRSGLGRGSSGPQLKEGAEILGHSIADFLVEWSQTGK